METKTIFIKFDLSDNTGKGISEEDIKYFIDNVNKAIDKHFFDIYKVEKKFS